MRHRSERASLLGFVRLVPLLFAVVAAISVVPRVAGARAAERDELALAAASAEAPRARTEPKEDDARESRLAHSNRWIRDRLPPALLRPGPANLALWQWLVIPLALGLALLGGLLLGRLTRASLTRVAQRTAATWDDAWLERSAGPLTLGWGIGCAFVLLPVLGFAEPAQTFARKLLAAGLFFVFFWTLFRTIDVLSGVASGRAWATAYPSARTLVPLGSRVAKVAVLAMGVVAMLAELGYPVASLIAGLGIGGLALALAAQKTVENLFGAFSLGVDQPFREGDFVKVDDFVGTVEAIGLRSTRIRTLDRTLISIPNGKLAEWRIESFTARDRIRLACTLGLVYETTSAQMREVLKNLEGVLRAHPKIWPDAVVVRFKEFGDSSLNVEIMAWFLTRDFGEFQLIRQEVLLGFMQVVEAAGSAFAFPTRTVHVAAWPERLDESGPVAPKRPAGEARGKTDR